MLKLVFKGHQAEAGGTGGWSAKAYNASPQEEENHATLSGWLAGAANTCGRDIGAACLSTSLVGASGIVVGRLVFHGGQAEIGSERG